MAQSREDSVYLAKLAEQAERYEGVFGLVPAGNLGSLCHSDVFRDGGEHEACRLL